jgi:poly(A) polymerase
MAHLGLEPGPLVGDAWRYLKDARLEEGPMTKRRAYELLDAWAQDRVC